VLTFAGRSKRACRATLSITNDEEHCQRHEVYMVYGLLRGLFVEACPACGAASAGGFCGVCAATFARVAAACPRCGLATPVARCPRSLAPWSVDAVVTPFAYAPPLDYYVHALKYRGARALGRAFALLLEPAVRRAELRLDALVAVPLHRTRFVERGYNQAQEIARALAKLLRVPALERGIARQRAVTQTGQGARQRRAAVGGAFRVARDLTGAHLAIVDDVVTTGATANALAAALKSAGAARCVAIAAARTAAPAQVPKT
jgi:ComF family protein